MSKIGPSKSALILITLCSILIIVTQRWSGAEGDAWKDTIASDGFGYYEYLPAIFIDKDLGFQNDSLAEAMQEARSLVEKDGRVLIKYTVGTALLQAPFFLVAHATAITGEHMADGYSKPYQFAVSIAALCYLMLGLWWTRSLMLSFELPDRIVAISILLIFFGTNLLYYALMQPAMSHVYSFSMIAGSFLFIRKTALTRQGKYLIVTGITFSLMMLVRPANALIVFAIAFLMVQPYLSEWIKLRLELFRYALMTSAIAIAVMFLQPLFWKLQAGSFFTWPYSGEGFYWGSPKILSFLISPRKGLFLYTPVLLLSLIGIWHMFKRDAERALNVCIYLVAVIYLGSAWWNWYYGDSFGQRIMIDHYAAFALLIGYGLNEMKKGWFRTSVLIASFGFVLLNLIQSWQYERLILDRYNMNMSKYAHVFLKTGKDYEGVLGGAHDIKPFSREEPQLVVRARTNIETMDRPFFGGRTLEDPNLAYSGNVVNELNEDEEFSTTFSFFVQDSLLSARRMYLVVEFKRMQPKPLGSEYALGVVSISSPDEPSRFYSSFRMNDIPPKDSNSWQQMRYAIDLPAFRSPNEELKFYIWNKEGQHFYIDDMMVSLHAIY